jgi:tetratricopeptide (TPR) repeat protein
MHWWDALALMIAAGLLLFVGLGIHEKRKNPQSEGQQQRSLEWLVFVMVGLLCIGGVLSSVGRLVFSPELGVVMIQGGHFIPWILRLLLLASSLAAGLAWLAGHDKKANVSKWGNGGWLLVVALGVGAWAAAQIQLLGQDDMGPVHIHAYDLWWPPLLLWYGLCLVGCALGLLGVRESDLLRRRVPERAISQSDKWWLRSWMGSVLLFALTLQMARYWLSPASRLEDAAFPAWHHGLLGICLLLSLPTSIGLTARLLLGASRNSSGWRRHGITGVAVLLLCVALAAVLGFERSPEVHSLDETLFVLWAIWLLVTGVSLAGAVYGALQNNLPRVSRPGWLLLFFFLFLLNALSLSPVAPLLSLPYSLGLQMAALLFVWGGLVEPHEKGVVAGCKDTLSSMKSRNASGQEPRQHASQQSESKKTFRMTEGLKALGLMGARLLALAVVLCILTEWPNARRTVIQPFKVTHLQISNASGNGDPARAHSLGLELSDRLLNALNAQMLLSQPDVVLQPRVLRPQKAHVPPQIINTSSSTLKQRDTSTLPTIITSPKGDSEEFSEKLELELGFIKVPVNLLAAPLRPPLRMLLGGRTLQGVLQEEPSRYTLLVKSSTGQNWKLSLDKKEELTVEEAIPQLAEQMALKILSEEPTWAAMGLTGSWEAFESYRSGMENWARFHETQDYSALSEAIRAFENAVHADAHFALAAYHLGLALQINGQTHKAAQSFRDGVSANPDFISGHTALFLASSLGQSPSSRPVAAPPPEVPAALAVQPVSISSLLQFMGRVPHLEQAQLYHGLCVQTLSSWEERLLGTSLLRELLAQAYFYCTQAQREYARVPASRRAEPDTRMSRASVLDQLGTILILHQQMRSEPFGPPASFASSKPIEQKGWFCASEDTYGEPITPAAEIHGLAGWNPRLQMALRYYERAAELTVDPEIRCDAAMLSFQLGNKNRMASLENDAAAHVNFAELHRAGTEARFWKRQQVTQTLEALFRLNSLLQMPARPTFDARQPEPNGFLADTRRQIDQYIEETRAQLDSGHARALETYQTAFELDPTHLDALAGFSRTFWQWSYHSASFSSGGPDPKWDAVATEVRKALEEVQTRFSNAPSGKGNGLSRKRETQVHAALGELHLAMNDPGRAREELDKARQLVDQRPCFAAIYWNLKMASMAERQTGHETQTGQGAKRERIRRALTACPALREGSWEKAEKCGGEIELAQR